MATFQFIYNKLKAQIPCVLLYVLNSKGSSPGRQGFRMAIAADQDMSGSIGGGIMEFKMVEKARDMLAKSVTSPFYKPQIHHKNTDKNQSGMICSGEQFIVLYPLSSQQYLATFEAIHQNLQQGKKGTLQLSPTQLHFTTDILEVIVGQMYHLEQNSPTDWLYSEKLGYKNQVHIIGGGHVGLALSRQLSLMDFHIRIYDDRSELITMKYNTWAHEQIIAPYTDIATHIPEGADQYVVIMTFGYRSDKVILRELYQKSFKYIGMMGSAAKIKQLFEEYAAEGIDLEAFKHVHTPIGLPIYSRSPAEIAVSIAAQITLLKNQNLACGDTTAQINQKLQSS